MARRSSELPSVRTVAATVVVAATASVCMSLSNPASLRVDGRRMIVDVPPVTTPKSAFVPLRAIAQSLGARTSFDPKSGAIVVSRGRDVLQLRAGSRAIVFDGQHQSIPNAPFLVRGRIMVGLATVALAFGANVRYEPARAKIDVFTPDERVPGADASMP